MWLVDLHEQLVEERDDAAEGEHAADGGHVDGGAGGGHGAHTQQAQPHLQSCRYR